MKITKELAKQFIDTIPLDIHLMATGKVGTVGVRWGYCGEADNEFGRSTVLAILDELETGGEFTELIKNWIGRL